MNESQQIQVIELRNYLLKPDTRDRFSDYFAEHFVDSQKDLGGYVLGQFTVKDNEDNFFWIRGFENMQTRSKFLSAFYYGPVWKEFGQAANEMMIDSDNVYLLKPLDELQIFRKKNALKIDFYFAFDEKLNELVNLFQTEYLPSMTNAEIGETTLWLSELSENDFPRLPAFQYENLLVVIRTFEKNAQLKDFDSANSELKGKIELLVCKQQSLINYEI
ncbi:MAG: NIPSNAP family protein [Actinomycetota bacterium]